MNPAHLMASPPLELPFPATVLAGRGGLEVALGGTRPVDRAVVPCACARMRSLAAGVAVAAGLTCSASDSRTPDVIVERRVVGDTTFVSTISGSAWRDTATVVLELRVGRLDGPDPYQFGGISDFGIGPDGSIYVHDSKANELRRFDSAGSFAGVMGRAGQGPGEYGAGGGLVVLGDGRVLMYDRAGHRVLAFAPGGDPLATIALRYAGIGYSGRALAVDTAGILYLRAAVVDAAGDGRALTAFIRLAPSGSLIDTLVLPRVAGAADNPGPFDFREVVAIHPYGGVIQGGGPAYAFDVRWSDGRVTRVSRQNARAAVSPEERAYWERRVATMRRQIIALRQDERGRNVPVYGEPPRIPAHKPWYWTIIGAIDGRVWVRRATTAESAPAIADTTLTTLPATPNLFDVFKATGEYLGAVRLPATLSPYHITATHIWGVEYGTFDEPYVARYRIVHP